MVIFNNDEKFVTLPEIKKMFVKEDEEKGLSEEKHHILEHADAFSFLSVKDTLEMLEKFRSIERINQFQAYKLVEIMPRSKEEVRSIFSKEILSPTEEEMDAILEIVTNYI